MCVRACACAHDHDCARCIGRTLQAQAAKAESASVVCGVQVGPAFKNPIAAVHDGASDHLYVAEQAGAVYRLDLANPASGPALWLDTSPVASPRRHPACMHAVDCQRAVNFACRVCLCVSSGIVLPIPMPVRTEQTKGWLRSPASLTLVR